MARNSSMRGVLSRESISNNVRTDKAFYIKSAMQSASFGNVAYFRSIQSPNVERRFHGPC